MSLLKVTYTARVFGGMPNGTWLVTIIAPKAIEQKVIVAACAEDFETPEKMADALARRFSSNVTVHGTLDGVETNAQAIP